MNFKRGMCNVENTVAFVKIDKYEGQTTTVSLDYLVQLTDFLKTLKKMGFVAVDIGFEEKHPLLIFLDRERKTAFAIAPRIEDE